LEVPVVDTFTHAITWLTQMFRAWQARAREQALRHELTRRAARDLHHRLNTTFWYLHPPN
jgi:hypothetical protein